MTYSPDAFILPLEGTDVSLVEMDRFDDPELTHQPTVWYDVLRGEDVIGNFGLTYDYEKCLAIIDIGLRDDAIGKGYGKAIYTNVPDLPLPNGHDFRENYFTFYSDRRSAQARRLWESLVKNGLAIHCPDDTYQLL